MRHKNFRLRLTQKPAHARMLQRNLVTSLLLYENVRTTKKRARVVQGIIDRLVACAKRQEPQLAIRTINRLVTDKNASRKLMEVYKDRFKDRSSGLTRIIPVGARKGDGAELVDLQFVVMTAVEDTDAPTTEKKVTAKKTSKPKKGSSASSK